MTAAPGSIPCLPPTAEDPPNEVRRVGTGRVLHTTQPQRTIPIQPQPTQAAPPRAHSTLTRPTAPTDSRHSDNSPLTNTQNESRPPTPSSGEPHWARPAPESPPPHQVNTTHTHQWTLQSTAPNRTHEVQESDPSRKPMRANILIGTLNMKGHTSPICSPGPVSKWTTINRVI